MPTSILISIKPQWCEFIASGKKTLEVRKNKPKLLTPPFKCYIYCTKYGQYQSLTGMCYSDVDDHSRNAFDKRENGKIIGEFVCDRIITIDDDAIHAFSHENYCGWNDCELDNACIDPEELEYYANDKWLYGWHISELIIYDEPRDLSEYGLARPPQSWHYLTERTEK